VPMCALKIAFTSCARYKPNQPQTAWNDIAAADPDYLFLLGDQIYMDFGLWPFAREHQGKPKQYTPEQFAAVMRRKYELQWSEPNFSRLMNRMRAKGGFLASGTTMTLAGTTPMAMTQRYRPRCTWPKKCRFPETCFMSS